MLDTDTKRRIESVHDILVGKVSDPKPLAQLEVLTFGMTEATGMILMTNNKKSLRKRRGCC
jgi:hypothetical protein